MTTGLNCSYFAVRDNFGSYAETLVQETKGNLSLISECKLEVCGSLWGTGNSDISGIGMIVGYALDHVIGLTLSTVILTQVFRNHPSLSATSGACLNAFQDSALFFAFSIEIAAIVVLVREDLGISTSGLGDDTVRITQAVAMLVLVALLYPIYSMMDARPDPNDAKLKTSAEHRKPPRRFSLFVLCWALAFYPFFSKMNASFGPRKIHKTVHHQHPVITPEQFSVIEHICLGDVPSITVREGNLMTAFVMLAYIPLSVFVVCSIVWMGVERNHHGTRFHRKLQSWGHSITDRRRFWLVVIAMFATPLLAAGLLWSILRAREFQQHLSEAIGGTDQDADWSFGQVVAVTVFAPVLVEGWGAWQKGRASAEPERASPTSTTEPVHNDVVHDIESEVKYERSLRTW